MTILSFFLSLLTILSTFAFAAEKALSKAEALDSLVLKIKKEHLYDWTTIECLDFVAGKEETDFYTATIYEKHNGSCPGDPNTSPRVDSFQINKTNGEYITRGQAPELHP